MKVYGVEEWQHYEYSTVENPLYSNFEDARKRALEIIAKNKKWKEVKEVEPNKWAGQYYGNVGVDIIEFDVQEPK